MVFNGSFPAFCFSMFVYRSIQPKWNVEVCLQLEEYVTKFALPQYRFLINKSEFPLHLQDAYTFVFSTPTT